MMGMIRPILSHKNNHIVALQLRQLPKSSPKLLSVDWAFALYFILVCDLQNSDSK